MTKRNVLLCAGAFFLALAGQTQAALFTSDTSIGPADTNYDGQDIVVIGCTVTIDGVHSFSDVLIIENGTVTHSAVTNLSGGGLNLTVSNNLVIEAGSGINANGLGFGPGLGAGAGSSGSNDLQFGFYYTSGGGGGYGGCGGSSLGGEAGGGSYGSLVAATNAGSGGGTGFGEGGAGGGLVNLHIGGALVLDGQISANGSNAVNLASGGGSGGGIFISAPSVSGAGSITASGGSGETSDGGGGGGGRIALFFTTNDFTGMVSAPGGQGSVAGGAGTIDLQSESGFGEQILVDNGGASGTNTPLVLPSGCSLTISGGAIAYLSNSVDTISISNLVVGSNSWLVEGPAPTLLQLSVESNAIIQAGGGINLNAVVTSLTGNSGGTNQSNGYTFGGGGGNGGNGGAGLGATGGAAAAGSVSEPTSLGSVGGLGSGTSPYNAGGAGGGAIEMNVAGTLTLNGSITASGGAGVGDGSGGGSGGSIYLTSGALAGAGAISANGGAAGSAKGGGGGGGRIAVNSRTNQFSGSESAAGGSGLVNGGAGTICLSLSNNMTPLLLLNNGGASGASTPIGGGVFDQVFNLTVTNGATLVETSESIGTLVNLVVGSNSFLIPSNGGAYLTVQSNATVATGGGILVAASATEIGPSESGGGYGGNGGVGLAGGSSASFGSLQEPTSSGTRGGMGSEDSYGGLGGGALTMTVSGTLLLNGSLTANGLAASLGGGAGGGSGGGLYVTTGAFGGSGSISANGGAGDRPNGGGGAGGRIAIYATFNGFTGSLSAYGAPGYVGGGAGTIYVTTNSSSIGQVIVDNGGTIGTNTPLSGLPSCDLTVANGAVAAVTGELENIRNLLVGSNGFIIPAIAQSSVTLQVAVSSNTTILPTGGIILDGKGSPGGTGAYAGSSLNSNSVTTGGGGGYAGYGGNSAFGAKGGGAASSPWNYSAPEGNAGGGGNGVEVGGLTSGGTGGGNLQLTVSGTLTMGGTLSANGTTGPAEGSGGGAGGGLWISAGTLAGSGTISANGGAGQLPYGGGGGGGVVRISSTSNQFTGALSAHGGAGAMAGGAGVLYEQLSQGAVVELVVDNGGLSGTNTPFSSPATMYDLTVTNGAMVAVSQGLQSYLRNLVIGSNSFIIGTGMVVFYFSWTGNATIWPTGGMIFDGDGNYNNSGSGAGKSTGTSGSGGGYGGAGGASSSGAVGGGTYGQVIYDPATGSGGGNVNEPVNAGGLGGGAIGLTTEGSLALGGKISANGTAGVTQGCGGGSGGGIYLTVGTLTGGGSITANGGSGQLQGGGGGGGGRISVIATTNQFTGSMSAQGGAGFASGGAGTVYVAAPGQSSSSQLILNNGGLTGPLTPVALPYSANVAIQGGARVAGSAGATYISSLLIGSNSFLVQTNPALMNLLVASNANVQAGGGIILDGSGSGAGGAGSGASTESALGYRTGGGGGHGGYGGNGQGGAAGGNVYDQVFTSPDMVGSGGGAGTGGELSSAPGGGALQLSVTGTLQLDGLISANGAVPTNEAGGGGSGGSIYLSAGVLAGAGTITANGASGDLPNGGGGGGGRIALRNTTNLFAGTMQARGGPGFAGGGAGTISLAGSAGAPGALIIDNGGLSGTNTPISAPAPYNLTISGAAVVVPQSRGVNLTIDSLLVESNAVLTHPSATGSVYFTVLSNAVVQSSASISVDGQGYNASAPGPGAGTIGTNDIGSGGGHGGMGGAGASGVPGGSTYDSLQQPAMWGSAGGIASTLDPNLSQGGGAIELTVGGTLIINGKVSANGNAAIFPGAGGGAGGSIWLTAGTLAGNGVITANGGAGQASIGGGGGGGRIALYCPTNMFAGVMTAAGAAGAAPGENGTIFLYSSITAPTVTFSVVPGLQSANLSFLWAGASGVTYQIQSSTNLIDWQSYGSAIQGTNGTMNVAVTLGGEPQLFFRLASAN